MLHNTEAVNKSLELALSELQAKHRALQAQMNALQNMLDELNEFERRWFKIENNLPKV